MCGIVGVASTEGMKNRSDRLQFMKMGLDIDSWRGWESTGLALVPEGSKEAPIVYKRALNGRDFIQLHQVDKYLADIEKYSVVLGHNRAATTGRGNIVDHNAHPFQYGHITLVHNGHIRNTNELKGVTGGGPQCLVDSAHVAFSMNANGEKETLEKIEGGFCFVWWNSETSLLNIARNTERPLHMAYATKENTFYWASELTELLHLLKDVDIDEEVGVLYPTPYNWYQFNLKNLREFEKIPFVKCQGRQNHHMRPTGQAGAGTNPVGPWTEAEIEEWENRYGTHQKTYPPISSSKSETGDTAEIEEIRQTVANQRLKDAKQSGVPTSKKRQTRAAIELRKIGFTPNCMKSCTPISWMKYKNQNSLGSVLARTRQEGHLVEVLQVNFDDYSIYNNAGVILVDCVNVRNGPKNDKRIVGIVSDKMVKFLEARKAAAERKEEANAAAKEGAGSIERNIDGPDGKITMARFLELSVNGCGYCTSDITPSQHKNVVWVHGSPICLECSTSPGLMETLGIKAVNENRQNVH